ncbi:hypothetical protein CU028_2121 [Enterococcus faecium]|nr:hypothetical protein [Enterococcus faecium]
MRWDSILPHFIHTYRSLSSIASFYKKMREKSSFVPKV